MEPKEDVRAVAVATVQERSDRGQAAPGSSAARHDRRLTSGCPGAPQRRTLRRIPIHPRRSAFHGVRSSFWTRPRLARPTGDRRLVPFAGSRRRSLDRPPRIAEHAPDMSGVEAKGEEYVDPLGDSRQCPEIRSVNVRLRSLEQRRFQTSPMRRCQLRRRGPHRPWMRRPSAPLRFQIRCQRQTAPGVTPTRRATSAWGTSSAKSLAAWSRRA